jgi:hypothetical protein
MVTVLIPTPRTRPGRLMLGQPAATRLGFASSAPLAFRRLYFGDWLTFHAKVHPGCHCRSDASLEQYAKTGRGAWLVLLLAALALTLVAVRQRPAACFGSWCLSLASAAYLLLPPDWMGEPIRHRVLRPLPGCWASCGLLTVWLRGRWPVPAGIALLLAETTAVMPLHGGVRRHSTVLPRASRSLLAPTTGWQRVSSAATRC